MGLAEPGFGPPEFFGLDPKTLVGALQLEGPLLHNAVDLNFCVIQLTAHPLQRLFDLYSLGDVGQDRVDEGLSFDVYDDVSSRALKKVPSFFLSTSRVSGLFRRCFEYFLFVQVEWILRLGMDEEGKGLLDEEASFDAEEAARGEIRPRDNSRLVERQIADRGKIVEICILAARLLLFLPGSAKSSFCISSSI